MFQTSDISLFAKLHFFQRINEDTYTFSSKWVKVFHKMSYWTFCVRLLILITLQTKISRKSGESIKILLKKILRFLDWRETTYSYHFVNKNLTQIWGIYKNSSKKDS